MQAGSPRRQVHETPDRRGQPADAPVAPRRAADLAEEVVECGDGDEAVAAYIARQFGESDWVLMDLQMPRVGGLEATRRLVEADPQARVIVVTQYDNTHWQEAARAAGAVGYVLKENLLEVRLLLSNRGQVDRPSRSYFRQTRSRRRGPLPGAPASGPESRSPIGVRHRSRMGEGNGR